MGKATIIYVVGLGMLVGYWLLNVNAAGTDAMNNYIAYYGKTVARNIAASGANMGCSDLFQDPGYSTPYNDVSFAGGTLNVRFLTAGNKMFVISTGAIRVGPETYRDTIVAELRNESLARYAWFTNQEANKGGQITTWSTGDTAWGPTHTNDKFNINGTPTFMKKATAWQKSVPSKSGAIWKGGYEWGIKIPYPTHMNAFISAAQDPVDGRAVLGNDAYLTFNAGGTIRLQVPTTGFDSTFANANAFTRNGAFAVLDANLYVQGTITGDMAVGSFRTGSATGGNVYITGDVLYGDDPRINPASVDKLGIYAQKDIQITYDPSNPGPYTNRRVDASIFSLQGVFEVQDAKSYPPRGRLTTFGAMMQYSRGEIGDVNASNGTLRNGYNKNFRYDERLITSPPKFYPGIGRYILFAWREG
jgi:hypothetical protein